MNRRSKCLPLMVLVSIMTYTSFARADITWDWTANNGAEQGTFTTNGSNVAPLAPGSYAITDASFIVSSVMPLGSISGGEYSDGNNVVFIDWNGSSITRFIDPTGTLGFRMFSTSSDQDPADFGFFASTTNPAGSYQFNNLTTNQIDQGDTQVTTPVLTPEPASLGLLSMGMIELLARRRRD